SSGPSGGTPRSGIGRATARVPLWRRAVREERRARRGIVRMLIRAAHTVAEIGDSRSEFSEPRARTDRRLRRAEGERRDQDQTSPAASLGAPDIPAPPSGHRAAGCATETQGPPSGVRHGDAIRTDRVDSQSSFAYFLVG